MNRCHRVVFNRAVGVMQAVSELARSRTRGARASRRARKSAACPSLACRHGSGGRPSRFAFRLALLSFAAVSAPVPAQAAGSFDIDGGTRVVVDGDDPDGTAPGTRPSPWHISPELLLNIGNTGAGSLVVRNAGKAYAENVVYVGKQAGSDGAMSVAGPGSYFYAPYQLYVGREGRGDLAISDGGYVDSGRGFIGDSDSGSGTVSVSGPGSAWQVRNDLTVGWSGRGSLVVADGGSVSTLFKTWIAYSPDSHGTVELDGTPGARGVLSTPYVEKGAGAGTLGFNGGMLRPTGDVADFLRNFAPGDIVVAGGGAFIDTNGFEAGVHAHLQGTGGLNKLGQGTLVATGGMDLASIGVQGGELRLSGGTNSLSGSVQADGAAGGQAKLVVDGPGSTLEAGSLTIGRSGAGRLELTGGARAALPGASSANALVIGYSGSADGEVLVSGANSVLSVKGGTTRIGRDAAGSLAIAAGGRYESGYQVTIGDLANGEGHVSVSGPQSTFATTGIAPTYVGDAGSGTLDILDGGRVDTSFFASVGRGIGGKGAARVAGAGSSWVVDGNLYIGENGKGVVTLADGGHIDLGDTAYSRVTLGRHEDGAGTFAIGAAADAAPAGAGTIAARSIDFSAGAGRLVFNHTSENYVFGLDLKQDPFNYGPGGSHSIEHLAGHTVYTGNGADFDGVTTISGGTLTVDGRLGGTVAVQAGATLGGSGHVGSTTVADGGRLAPGASIGALTVAGDLALSPGSILDYELGAPGAAAGSPGASDRIDVQGDLTLDGTLNLAQSGAAGDGTAGIGYYRLMTYGGQLHDNGLALGNTPSPDKGYAIQAAGGRVDLYIGTAGDDTLQHWQGGDGTWNAGDARWINQNGDVPAAWAGHHAVFKNQPGGFDGGTIDVVGTQSFAGLQFVDEGYRLQGPGSLATVAAGSEIRVLADSAEIASNITGPGGIVKTEAGTLVLSGANTYMGGTTIRGGVLSVSNDANLGHEDGALAFDGGVLRVTGTDYNETGRRIVWGARGGGFDIVEAANHYYLDRDIVGPGDLVKRGAGALWLAGTNAYGNTRVEGGSLVGDAGSISGNIANAGTVVFQQAGDARFAGDIAGLEGARGTMVKSGAGTLTLEGASALDWTVAEGGLEAAAARFGGNVRLDGQASALTFTDAGAAAYGAAISGNGVFTFDGGGTLLLKGDSSAFAGMTKVANGTLLVGGAAGGALGGSLEVLAGAALGGSGIIGSGAGSRVTVAPGGTLAPGNSLGTLTVDGDLVFEPGSRFMVEVDPGGSGGDQVKVTGKATLAGGSVAHVGARGDYDPRSVHTILSAGELAGKFDEVVSDFAFLAPSLAYDYGAGTVDLELVRNNRDFASAALTRNQQATAGGIDSIGMGAAHPVYDAIARLPDDAGVIRASLDSLSGEIHASAESVLIEDSRYLRNAAYDRVRAAFGSAGAPADRVVAYDSAGKPARVAANHGGPVFWARGLGSWGALDGDGNAAGLDRSTGGLLVGADCLFGGWRIGLLGGYSHTRLSADARRSSGKSDNYHLGLYGGTQWGGLAFRAGAAYTWHHVDTSRSVAVPGIDERLSAGYDAGTLQAFGELAYGIQNGSARFEPFARLAHVKLHRDGYTETGGAAALTGRAGDTDISFGTLGLRAARHVAFGRVEATLSGMAGWRHAFGDRAPESVQSFSAGNAFSVAGAPIARDSAVVEAGLSLDAGSGTTFSLSYTGQLSHRARDHGFTANLAIRF